MRFDELLERFGPDDFTVSLKWDTGDLGKMLADPWLDINSEDERVHVLDETLVTWWSWSTTNNRLYLSLEGRHD